MDRAVLSGNEIVVSSIIDWEVNGETTGVNEGHATCLLLIDSTSIDILLIWLGLALQLLQISVFETLLHGPLDDTTIT